MNGLRDQVRSQFAARRIELKSAGEFDAMRAAGLLVARTLGAIERTARPGVSTAELDELAEQQITEAGAVPSFKGYQGFPGSVCVSVNEQIVHGIPSPQTVLAAGDLLSVDCGAILDGWHGDAAVTLPIGAVGDVDRALSAATRASMYAGIAEAVPGAHLTDISQAVEATARQSGTADGRPYGLITEYGGHGIGTRMHMEPFVPNVGPAGKGPRLRQGMALAIEPMLTSGTADSVECDDGWTVVTADGSRAAHWEHTVAITEDGPWILTAAEDAGTN